MKRLQTICLVVMTALLASCGGGGSPYVAATDAGCSLPLRFANTSSNSGIAIPESNNWTPLTGEVGRSISGCAIERLETLRVGICLKHPQLDDLQIRVSGPNGNTQTVPLSGVSATTDTLCSALDASARQVNLNVNASAFTTPSTFNGVWLVQARDNTPGYESGVLVGWSLQLGGHKW